MDVERETDASERTPDQSALRERIRKAAADLASKEEPPKPEEWEAYFSLANDLAGPDFKSRFEAERVRNTKRYREVAKEVRQLAGIAEDGELVT